MEIGLQLVFGNLQSGLFIIKEVQTVTTGLWVSRRLFFAFLFVCNCKRALTLILVVYATHKYTSINACYAFSLYKY